MFCVPGELSQQGSKHKEEAAILQKSISALDREKDALQDEVDQKTEKLVVLQEENSKKVFTAITPQDHLLLKDRLTFLSALKQCSYAHMYIEKVIVPCNHSFLSYWF